MRFRLDDWIQEYSIIYIFQWLKRKPHLMCITWGFNFASPTIAFKKFVKWLRVLRRAPPKPRRQRSQAVWRKHCRAFCISAAHKEHKPQYICLIKRQVYWEPKCIAAMQHWHLKCLVFVLNWWVTLVQTSSLGSTLHGNTGLFSPPLDQ